MLFDASQDGIFTRALPINNWPGFHPANWSTAIATLQTAYAKVGGLTTKTRALSIKRNFGDFTITTKDETFRANVVVIATGRRPQPVPFKITTSDPGRILSRLWDESFLTQNDIVAVIGPGPIATESAIRAAERAKRVYLFRQPLSVIDPAEERVILQFPKISRMYATQVTGVIETSKNATVEYVQGGSKSVLRATWVVLANEWTPNSEAALPLVPCDSTHAIIVQGPGGQTAVPGIFACGEVSSTGHLLGVLASAEGVRTAQSVRAFLMGQHVLPTPTQETVKVLSVPAPEEEMQSEETEPVTT
jgi:thioredoxin reductase (NADPH)